MEKFNSKAIDKYLSNRKFQFFRGKNVKSYNYEKITETLTRIEDITTNII